MYFARRPHKHKVLFYLRRLLGGVGLVLTGENVIKEGAHPLHLAQKVSAVVRHEGARVRDPRVLHLHTTPHHEP